MYSLPAQEGKHIRCLRQDPAGSWLELTASEQILPLLLAKKQLQNHGGSPGEATPYKWEEQLRRRGKQRKKKNLATCLPWTICFLNSREDCVAGPGRQSVGICHSWVNPQTAGGKQAARQGCPALKIPSTVPPWHEW